MSVYDSLKDVPLDSYSDDDHDDSTTAREAEVRTMLAFAVSSPPPPDPHLAVPYVYLKRGSRGKPVVALVRALSVAGHGKWKGRLFSSLLGPFAEKNLNSFKRKHGLPANGVYDRSAHEQLAPFYDPYAIVHLLNTPKLPKDQQARNRFLAELMYLYNRRTYEHYTQTRPFDISKPPYGLDCSASGEWGARWAGLKSLSGFSSFGYGNTDSQLLHFKRVSGIRSGVKTARVGDPIYYGRGGDPSHVAYWIGEGRVWSFGAYPIKILQHDYRHDRIAVCDLMAAQ